MFYFGTQLQCHPSVHACVNGKHTNTNAAFCRAPTCPYRFVTACTTPPRNSMHASSFAAEPGSRLFDLYQKNRRKGKAVFVECVQYQDAENNSRICLWSYELFTDPGRVIHLSLVSVGKAILFSVPCWGPDMRIDRSLPSRYEDVQQPSPRLPPPACRSRDAISSLNRSGTKPRRFVLPSLFSRRGRRRHIRHRESHAQYPYPKRGSPPCRTRACFLRTCLLAGLVEIRNTLRY